MRHCSRKHRSLTADLDTLERREAVSILIFGADATGKLVDLGTPSVSSPGLAPTADVSSQAASTGRTSSIALKTALDMRGSVELAAVPGAAASRMPISVAGADADGSKLAAQTRAMGQPRARVGGDVRPLTLAPHAPTSASSGVATSLAAQTRAAGQPMARGGGGIRPLTLAPHAPASASSGAAASSATSATPAPMPLVADHPAAMAAPGTAMTNPGPFGYVLSGSGGSGGSSPPTTTINYSGGWSTVDSLGRYHDVIGDNATISVANPPPASGWSVASVTWNISGPASVLYDSEKIPPDTADGHFVYHVPTVLSATQNFWWGASGGLDTITANVTYVQYVYGIANYGYSSGSIQVSVAFPTTTVDVTPMAPGLRTNPSTGYKAMESGIDWHPGVASKLDDAATTFVPYELGFIQRIQSGDDTRSDSTGTNPTQNVMIIPHSGSNPAQSPRPLVDVYSAGNPFYPFFYAAGGSATGVPQSPPTQTIPTAATALNTWYDHPYLDLPVPTTPGYNDYTMNLSFVDTFMYRPLSPGGSTPAGIYVPLGAFTWSVTVEAKYTPAGGWAFNPFTTQNPTVNGTLSMPPNVITFSTGANPFWPYWVDYVGDFTSSPFWKTA